MKATDRIIKFLLKANIDNFLTVVTLYFSGVFNILTRLLKNPFGCFIFPLAITDTLNLQKGCKGVNQTELILTNTGIFRLNVIIIRMKIFFQNNSK
jgi:hypothetical protein